MKIYYGEDLGLCFDQLATIKFTKKLFLSEHQSIFNDVNENDLFFSNDKKTFLIIDDQQILDKKINNLIIDVLNYLKNFENVYIISEIKNISKDVFLFFKQDEVFNIKKLNLKTIKNYINHLLNFYNLKLCEDSKNFLYQNLKHYSIDIKNEIYKISNLDKNDLTFTNIKLLIQPNIEKNIFEILINFFDKNFTNIIKQLNYLEYIKINYVEIFNILVLQLFNIKMYCLHYIKNNDLDLLIKEFNLSYFQIKNYLGILKNKKINLINELLDNLNCLFVDFLNGKKDLSIGLKVFFLGGI